MIKIFVENKLNQPLEHEYNLYANKDSAYLEYANSESPYHDTIASLEDNEDHLVLKIDKKAFNIQYHEAEQILILLLQNYNTKMNFVETKITKSI